ncbi:unnamed protein product [Phytophthora fragariaefolia]|uniref:Unnamed protein product n=1 Tax=Phytophthora fragariaefolia TaxID=1490495 RepID=A0A9W7D9A7_9STRA|nr:unnamed protein product [Phytophthora fragariaefolia]
MKVYKSPLGPMYVVPVFFVDCLSCIRRRNQASKYFRCQLPSLDIYLADLTTEGPVDEAQYLSDEEINFFQDKSDLSSWDGSDEDSESGWSGGEINYEDEFEDASDDGGADESSDEDNN